MSTISLRLPDSLHEQGRQLAERDQVSIKQFITVALAEKLSALMTEEYLRERAQRGSRAAFEAVMAKVADTPPEEHDKSKPAIQPDGRYNQRPTTARASTSRPGAGCVLLKSLQQI